MSEGGAGKLFEKRVISAAIVLPLVVAVFVVGGWLYVLLIVLAMLLGGLEYTRMFRRLGYAMSNPLLMLLIVAWQADAIWALGVWQLPLYVCGEFVGVVSGQGEA